VFDQVNAPLAATGEPWKTCEAQVWRSEESDMQSVVGIDIEDDEDESAGTREFRDLQS
jgi:hypothetical protein